MVGRSNSGRRATLSVLICLLFYLACVSLPGFAGIDQNNVVGAMRFLLLPFAFYLLFQDIGIPKTSSVRNMAICIPLLFMAAPNMLSLLSKKDLSFDGTHILEGLIFSLGTALAEETIFRFGIIEAIKSTKLSKLDILLSSFIFGLAHLLSILAGANPMGAFIQAGYSFSLGLLLGIAYKIGGLVPAIIIHYLFNFFQNDLYTAFGNTEWDLPFYVLNITFYALCLGYASFLYLRKKKCIEKL